MIRHSANRNSFKGGLCKRLAETAFSFSGFEMRPHQDRSCNCIQNFVSDALQSKGIGKQLLDHAKNKHNELSLQVYQKSERAVRFYLRENFAVSTEQLDENSGETEFVMHWRK